MVLFKYLDSVPVLGATVLILGATALILVLQS